MLTTIEQVVKRVLASHVSEGVEVVVKTTNFATRQTTNIWTQFYTMFHDAPKPGEAGETRYERAMIRAVKNALVEAGHKFDTVSVYLAPYAVGDMDPSRLHIVQINQVFKHNPK